MPPPTTASAMKAFLDSNLGVDLDDANDEEVSALSNALDDQSYHIVQHLIHELGESRTKEEKIRQEFDAFRKWIKKISVQDLIADVETVMDENERLLTELHNVQCRIDRLASEVDRLRDENYDYKMKLLAATTSKSSSRRRPDEMDRRDKRINELSDQKRDLQERFEQLEDENRRLLQENVNLQQQQKRQEDEAQRAIVEIQKEMQEDLHELQHMLEEAVREKQEIKKEVERMTQEVLIAKAETEKRRLREADAATLNDSKTDHRIEQLELALQDLEDDYEQLERMMQQKIKQVDKLINDKKELKAQIVYWKQQQASFDDNDNDNKLIQLQQQHEEELAQIQQEIQQFNQAVNADKQATESLMNQMTEELENLKEFSRGLMEENVKMERRNNALSDKIASCSCQPNTDTNATSGKSRDVNSQSDSRSTFNINEEEDKFPDDGFYQGPQRERRSNASLRLMSLIRDRFNNSQGQVADGLRTIADDGSVSITRQTSVRRLGVFGRRSSMPQHSGLDDSELRPDEMSVDGSVSRRRHGWWNRNRNSLPLEETQGSTLDDIPPRSRRHSLQ